jgi:hypothetical protein
MTPASERSNFSDWRLLNTGMLVLGVFLPWFNVRGDSVIGLFFLSYILVIPGIVLEVLSGKELSAGLDEGLLFYAPIILFSFSFLLYIGLNTSSVLFDFPKNRKWLLLPWGLGLAGLCTNPFWLIVLPVIFFEGDGRNFGSGPGVYLIGLGLLSAITLELKELRAGAS